MSKKGGKAGIIAASVLTAGLAIGGVTTGMAIANKPLDITYYANNGTPAVTAQVKRGENLNLPTPTRTGYNFAGWYLDVALTKELTKPTQLKQNSKLYAGWELTDGTVLTSTSANGETTAQAETQGLKSIGAYAFANSKITSITIPDTVTTIGDSAFANCTNLTNVTFGTNLTTIGTNAFVGTNLSGTLTITNSVTTIGENAFKNCTNIKSLVTGGSETSIAASAFSGITFQNIILCGVPTAYKTALNQSSLSGTLTFNYNYPSITTDYDGSISDDFAACLTDCANIVIGDTVTDIGENSFVNLNKIISITIGKNVRSIGSYAFYGCVGVKSLTIPENVNNIGINAFNNCKALEEINFNAKTCNEVTFNRFRFENCGTLSEGILLNIGSQVTSISARMFYLANITDIVINSANNNFISRSGVIYNKDKTSLIMCLASKGGNFIVPSSVTSIEPYAFYKCKSLENVTISNGVKSIGEFAFYGCSSLTSITIPETINSIGLGAFTSCSGLTELYFNATQCEDNGFQFEYVGDSEKGVCLKIGANVTKLFASMLYKANITDIIVDSANANFASENGVLYNKNKTRIILCKQNQVGKFVVLNGVTNIENYAFYNCANLTNVSMPNTVKIIGDRSFSNCKGLKTIILSNQLTAIGANAFRGCSSLSSIEIPSSVTYIGSYAFYNCSSMAGAITIPNGVTYIGDSTFYNCQRLESVVIENGVKTIDQYAFYDCTSLTNITLGNALQRINIRAFGYCTSLMQIYIPSSVTTINTTSRHNSPFYYCFNNLQIRCGAAEQPSEWGTEWEINVRTGKAYNVTWGVSS